MDFNITVANTKIKDVNKSAMEIDLDDLAEHLQDSTKEPPVPVEHLQDSTEQPPEAVEHLHDSTKQPSEAVGPLLQQPPAAGHQYDTVMKKEITDICLVLYQIEYT
jgi:hypothetical protein